MTELVNFSELCDYEEFRISYQEHIALMLSEIQRLASPVFLFFSDERPIESRILEIDPESGCVVLANTPEFKRVHRIIASGVFVVVDHEHSQIQFHIDGVAQLMDGPDSDYLMAPPDKLYLIQRRNGLRHAIPDRDLACCTLQADGKSLKLPLLDISEEGLALLDSGRHPQLVKDSTIDGVEIRLPTGSLHCRLHISSLFTIYLAREHKQVNRLGCRMLELDEASADTLERYLATLSD